MDINKCIEVLRRPNSFWQFSRKNIENKITALAIIKNEERFYYVSFLVDSLKDNSPEVRQAACDTIIYLFKKANGKNELYNNLKYCNISTDDIDFYQRTFSTDSVPVLLGIASFNHSGYVRQKAVARLSNLNSPEAIRFLIYRLADWVNPVSQAARQGIKNYQSTIYLDHLIDNLNTLARVQKNQRVDLSSIYSEVGIFITENNRDQVRNEFHNYPDKSRFLIAKLIFASHSADFRDILLKDRYFPIRSLALSHFDHLSYREITAMLNDKSAAIRLQVLRKLFDQPDFGTMILNYVADSSASVRHFSRFTLRNSNVDFAKIYHQNLVDGKQIIGSLYGLAEVDGKQHGETIKLFLKSNNTKIKKTAFLALRKLDPDAAGVFALDHIDSNIPGLRNISIDFLCLRPNGEVLGKARECFKKCDYELRKAMLNLFHKIGGWAALGDIMMGTIDENEDIRQVSYTNLKLWRAKAVGLFIHPKDDEIERSREIFKYVYEIHKTKNYFKNNPLDGLDFYLR